MYATWLEEVRFNLESIEVLQKAIVSEMLSIQDNPKERSISEHKINHFAAMIQQKSKDALNFIRDQNSLKKEQLSIIEGQKSLKISDKKKPADVIWQNFYDKAKQLKDSFKNKQPLSANMPTNTIEYFREAVFKPPFKEPQFSAQENKGKYVDMHSNYFQFLNICKIMDDEKSQRTTMHDYLWFLQNLDRFDDFPIKKKFKFQTKYLAYLQNLEAYLISFLKRSKPLFEVEQFMNSFNKAFVEKYSQGKLLGWEESNVGHIDESKTQYCHFCKKIFISNEAFVNHLMGKKHVKLSQNPQEEDNQNEAEITARKEFLQENQNRKKTIAFNEFKIFKLREELATIFYDTMNLVRKKQTRGYEELEENDEEESQSEEADAPIYNPKNLPLGWDGKPIPYWLYKLHGLGIEYKCQICGNFSYWGRRAFEMHFQEWRHTYGMKCLKIPNTIHFKDITTINDALALHEKLMRQSQESQFRPDMQEEYEDNEGNMLNKKTYLDMKKQGLIDK